MNISRTAYVQDQGRRSSNFPCPAKPKNTVHTEHRNADPKPRKEKLSFTQLDLITIPDPGSGGKNTGSRIPVPTSSFTQAINKLGQLIRDPGSGSDHCSTPDPDPGSKKRAPVPGSRIPDPDPRHGHRVLEKTKDIRLQNTFAPA